jgi:hypothetical protein
VFGKLIPVVFRSGRSGSLVSDDKVPAPQQNTFTIATIAAGARPMLHTAQGFPFDMRRSRVEAGRLRDNFGLTCCLPTIDTWMMELISFFVLECDRKCSRRSRNLVGKISRCLYHVSSRLCCALYPHPDGFWYQNANHSPCMPSKSRSGHLVL